MNLVARRRGLEVRAVVTITAAIRVNLPRATTAVFTKLERSNDVMFVKLPSASCDALQHINLIGLTLYDTRFYVRDYKLLALSWFPRWCLRFVTADEVYCLSSLSWIWFIETVEKSTTGNLPHRSSERKGTISESQIVFVSLSLGSNSSHFCPSSNCVWRCWNLWPS